MNVIRSNTGDSNNPLGFFEDFFPEGFDKLYTKFFFVGIVFNNCHDRMCCNFPYQAIKEVNETEGYVLRQAIHDGRNTAIIDGKVVRREPNAPSEKRFYFRDELETILKPQIDAAIKHTIDNIQQIRDKDSQTTYIHTLFTQIEYIINNKLKHIVDAKYEPQCKVYLVLYMREIVKRYPYLINTDATYTKLLNENTQNEFTTLLIVPHKQDLIPRLYNKLKPKFIDEGTTPEIFTKAFTGVQLKEGESLGIKWVYMRKKKCYLGALVIMLDYMLSEAHCLNQYDDRQLSNIFVTDEGEYVIPSNWNRRRKDANKPEKKDEPIFRELRGIIDTTIR